MRKLPAHSVAPGGPGQALVTSPDGLEAEWGTAGATSLGELSDVDLATDPPAGGDTLVWDEAVGKYVPGTPALPVETTVLVPLTTVVGETPELVWDEGNNLVMTEVPR